MQCYICVTYLLIICNAYPPKVREISAAPQRRSLFHDVIESLRIRAQLPDDFSSDEENNLGPSDERYGYENEPLHQPNDVDFLPRRNDRLEMPTLKYRYPKNLKLNKTQEEAPKEEIVLYINAPSEDNDETTTTKPNKIKRPKPVNKIKTKTNEDDDNTTTEQKPFTNTMSGQSHIGNRESQTVVKPTVIVNFRGSVSHRESDIRLERQKYNDTKSIPQNIFNINQEIKLERPDQNVGSSGVTGVPNKVKQDIKIKAEGKARVEEDMMMCETASWKDDKSRSNRQTDVLEILLSI
ncbi:uncharacterized protein LOC123692851 [Colias croceus]|uniref:uncharacterized protein LOC123692851 n=1 Tax=Colias crocea TaxID=72248 RepID=UPI001E27BB64|nr:uncharacterized protein LOC123692851 [Colias croceus]